MWWGLISISIPSVGRTVLGLGAIEELLITYLVGDGVRKDKEPYEDVSKSIKEDDGDSVDISDNDDDEYDNDDENFDDRVSGVRIW